MESCNKCNKVLYYEPTCGGMCMECWAIWGRIEMNSWDNTETPTDFIPLVKEDYFNNERFERG